ncbi:MAG: signal transduction histidine kinase, LytS [Rhodoferax sp.]|nr:signal transduction histidine kinase, LytS [Rhodoferax sp.]
MNLLRKLGPLPPNADPRPVVDWIEMLRHYLHTLALCFAISAIFWFLKPEKPYIVPLVYSLWIGTITWLGIDFGRLLMRPDPRTGWPHGLPGLMLVAGSIVMGYILGTLAGDACFGWSSWERGAPDQRTSIIVTVLAGTGASYYFFAQSRSAFLHGKMEEVQRQSAEAQLKLLQTQLEPHMLFNTLANLRVLIGQDPAAAQEMLDRLIAFLRATLLASRTTTHPLSAEFERLRDYLELMAIRMGPRLQYTLDLPEALAGLPVPTLLLQPLVENAIRHGLEPKVGGGRISVAVRRNDADLVLTVTDNGAGLPEASTAGGTVSGNTSGGFGLTQVRERLATAYGADSRFAFGPGPNGGAEATITLPCTP